MNGYSQLKGFTHTCRLDAGTNASPERRIQKNHIDGGIQNSASELLKVDHHGIGCCRNTDHFPYASHTVQTPGRIFKIIVLQVLDGVAEVNGLLDAEGCVRVIAQAVLRKGVGQSPVAFQLIAWRKYTPLQLMGSKSVTPLQIAGMLHQFLRCANFILSRFFVWIAEKEVACKR